MIRIKFILISILLFSLGIANGQKEAFYKSYDWDTTPEYQLTSSLYQEVGVKSKYISEFIYEGEKFFEYYLEHEVVWLNSDEAIEKNNKVYLPYSSLSELVVSKGRVITKDGKVINLDDSKILTAENEETGQKYKYFAFEGIELGSYIEYLYVVKRNPKYTGTKISLQSEIPKYDVSFELFSPDNLEFAFKSYNGLAEVSKDTLMEDKNHWEINIETMEPLANEDQSPYLTSLQSFIYKLDRNSATNTYDITSYDNVAQNLYAFYYPEREKKTKKAVRKFTNKAIGEIDIDKEKAIKKLELYIKSNVYSAPGKSKELEDLDYILKNKIANETGLISLYIASFLDLGIKHELVLTSNRKNLAFDNKFEAYCFLDEFLFYFPKFKTYISPTNQGSYYPFPPAMQTDNYGLFIKKITLGGFDSGISKIKYIKPIEAKHSYDKMLLNISFDEDDITTCMIDYEKRMFGYSAAGVQSYFNFAKKDEIDELLTDFGKQINEDVEILKKELIDEDNELFGIKPLVMKFKLKSSNLVEKAGTKYIFKVGEVIGRQVEMYQKKKRRLPAEVAYQKHYYRTITVKIPKGYKFVNLDDINIKSIYNKDGEDILGFDSYYKLEGDVLTIEADEYYKINHIALSFFDDYVKVINSAADFNKVTLILEPAE